MGDTLKNSHHPLLALPGMYLYKVYQVYVSKFRFKQMVYFNITLFMSGPQLMPMTTLCQTQTHVLNTDVNKCNAKPVNVLIQF